jgi:hypothetical protein
LGTITVPTGFTLIHDYVSANVSGAFAFKVSDGTETSVQWTWTTSDNAQGWCGVYTGLTATPFDVSQEANSGVTAVASQTTGTTAATAQADELAVAVMAVDTGANVSTNRAWTNSFSEFAWAANDNGLSVAQKILTSTGTVETTFSGEAGTDQMWCSVVTFKASV